jgi:hypothetical protein
MSEPTGYVTCARWTPDQLDHISAVWHVGEEESLGCLSVIAHGQAMKVVFITRDGHQKTLTQKSVDTARIDASGVFHFS